MKKERVALYPRVSTQEQALNGYSIDEQIERMTKYCEAMGWTVYKVYTDAGFSGASTDRPALQRMIKDIKAGKVDKVLVYKLDRLSRSQKDTLLLIEDVFLANGVDFVSMSENFDTSTPFGRAMVGILAVFAQLEREQIKERMAMGREARAKQGKFNGGKNVPIGYDYINGEFVTNEYEKMQVLKVFELFQSGESLRHIEQIMHESGYAHKYGEWNTKTLRGILRTETYLGYVKYKGTWYRSDFEQFIDEETHAKVVDLLDERAKAHSNGSRRGRTTSYLTGFLRCKHCGGRYYKDRMGERKYPVYGCYSRMKKHRSMIKDPNCKNKNWRMEQLDDLVFNEIKKLATDPDYFNQIKPEKPKDNKTELIKSEIEKLEKQTAKLMDLYALGNMPLEMIEKRMNEINDQKKKLEYELEFIIEDEKKKLSKDDTIKAVTSFEDVLNRGVYEEIRTALETLIDYIEIDNEIVDIHWKFI